MKNTCISGGMISKIISTDYMAKRNSSLLTLTFMTRFTSGNVNLARTEQE